MNETSEKDYARNPSSKCPVENAMRNQTSAYTPPGPLYPLRKAKSLQNSVVVVVMSCPIRCPCPPFKPSYVLPLVSRPPSQQHQPTRPAYPDESKTTPPKIATKHPQKQNKTIT